MIIAGVSKLKQALIPRSGDIGIKKNGPIVMHAGPVLCEDFIRLVF